MAPERIESALKKAAGGQQVFVHGNSCESCVVAVVVPDEKALRQAAHHPAPSLTPVFSCASQLQIHSPGKFSKNCPMAVFHTSRNTLRCFCACQ